MESKSEAQISLDRRFRIAKRIDNRLDVRLELSFSKRTAWRLIIETDVDVKLR